jgi:hypothetical protein
MNRIPKFHDVVHPKSSSSETLVETPLVETNESNYLKTLNNDIFTTLILDNLFFLDTVKLCNSSKELRQKCNKVKIWDKMLKRDAKISYKPTYNSLDQLKLIYSSYQTWYSLNYRTGEVSFYTGEENQNTMFSIGELPPPSGTRVYIIGYISYNVNARSTLVAFSSREAAINYIKHDERGAEYIMGWDLFKDIILESLGFYDLSLEEGTKKALEYIATNDLLSDLLIYTYVVLP